MVKASREAPPTGTVTFLFTDIEGSTPLWEQRPEAMARSLAHHNTVLQAAIEAHGGIVFKTVGDAFCAAFATPHQAVAAAVAAQRALQAPSEAWGGTGPLRVRMGLHLGLADWRDGDYVGPTLNRVARVMSAGHGGQILLTAAVAEGAEGRLGGEVSLQDLGHHRLKGLSQPEHLYQALAPGLPVDFPALKSLDVRPNNLPLLPTPLVGRVRELADLGALLLRPDVRLVTLMGVGGTGKTRLALELAAQVLATFTGGVYFVNLAPVLDPALVPSAIAKALGVRETGSRPLLDSLQDFLRDKRLLLVLDNFEHLVQAAPLVTDLLLSAAFLKVLVTSREALRLHDEHTYPLAPLPLPQRPPVGAGHLQDPDRYTAQVAQADAVQLFVQRAEAVKPGFQVTRENAATLAHICHRLDGLPLALELAAARVRVLSLEAMLERLAGRLRFLVGGARDLPARQQTLRATIEWSHDLLDEGEKRLFRRLAVFVGGRTLAAVEAVCNAEDDLGLDVLDGVESLVSKSLLRQDEGPDGEPRFILLETLHEFAAERLDASGETRATRARHAAFFLQFAERAAVELRGAQTRRWLDRLEAEHDNLRAALQWSIETGEAETGLRLAGALVLFWRTRGYLSEGRRWVAIALGLSEGGDAGLRARILNGASDLANKQGDFGASKSLAEQALGLAEQAGDRQAMAEAVSQLGVAARDRDDYATAEARYEEALTLYRVLGDQYGEARTLHRLGVCAHDQNDFATARLRYGEAIALFRALGEKLSRAAVMSDLGLIAYYQGDYTTARVLLEESLALRQDLGDKLGLANGTLGLALVASGQADYPVAHSLLEQALALTRDIDDKANTTMTLTELGKLANWQGRYSEAEMLLNEGLALGGSLGSRSGLFNPLVALGRLERGRGEYGRARERLEQGLALGEEVVTEDASWSALALTELSLVASGQGDAAAALDMAERAVALSQPTGQKLLLADAVRCRGGALRERGRTAEARADLLHSLRLNHAMGTRRELAESLEALGRLAAREGDGAPAARLLGAAAALRESLGAPLPPADLPRVEHSLTVARGQLGDAAFSRALAEGRAMTPDDAVAYAVGSNEGQ